MQRAKYIAAGLVLSGILAGVTGCGPVNTAGDSVNSVSGSAVTESAVSGSASAVASTDRDVERNRYANHNNIYQTTYDISDGDEFEEDQKLAQMKSDGTVVQTYDIKDLDAVAWVTDEWVYYVTDSPECILWRAPIEKAEGGDRLEPDRAEKLLLEGFMDGRNVYVADTGVFYIADKEGVVSEIRQYDFAKKKSVLLKKTEGYTMIRLADGALKDSPIMLGDSLFIQHDSELYTLDTANASLKEIYKGMNVMFPDNIVEYGDSIYFVPDSEKMQVYRYDGEKTECVIKKGVMKKKIFDLDYPTGGRITIQKIFTYKDRMYFYVPVRSEREDYWYSKAQLLLSAPVDDLLNLKGDDKFSGYMYDHSTPVPVSYDYEAEQEQGQLLKVGEAYFYGSPLVNVAGGWDGKLILKARYFVPTSGVGYYDYDYAIYDLDTGEIEETEAAKAVLNKDAEALRKALISSHDPFID